MCVRVKSDNISSCFIKSVLRLCSDLASQDRYEIRKMATSGFESSENGAKQKPLLINANKWEIKKMKKKDLGTVMYIYQAVDGPLIKYLSVTNFQCNQSRWRRHCLLIFLNQHTDGYNEQPYRRHSFRQVMPCKTNTAPSEYLERCPLNPFYTRCNAATTP